MKTLFLNTKVVPLAFLLVLADGLLMEAQSQVTLWETNLVIPTYRVLPPDPNPRFFQGRGYQGARGAYYPYPVMDKLTETREDRGYKTVFLENQYVQLSVIPELGGRIFSAMDKGNTYDFFYRQHVIKPALIGMLGAWISGGVEWNVPHHHRATSFMPVDCTTEARPDGSKTIWVGETELRHRMKWLVGITLHPEHSYIELTVLVHQSHTLRAIVSVLDQSGRPRQRQLPGDLSPRRGVRSAARQTGVRTLADRAGSL